LQLDDRAEHAAFEPLPSQFGEETLEARMSVSHAFTLGCLWAA
jgi:hypothetical protein